MTRTFTIADPGTFEGTPYEVAERAIRQSRSVVLLAREVLAGAEPMIRNAQLSRNLLDTPEDARADEWDEGPQQRKITAVLTKLAEVNRELSMLERAAGYDPQHPPKE